VPAGERLKALRHGRHITGREVECASRRIADARSDSRFCISNGWLAQLENGASEPSICKLFSLSVIYRVNFLDLVRLYNVDVDEKEKYEPLADPYVTQLMSRNTNGDGQLLFENSTPNSTSLMQAVVNKDHAPHIVYAHLGLADFTMYPVIRPNALLRIDTSQNKLKTVAWHNEYERPIFFVELRGAYACGWCELQSNQLLIIPHPSSPVRVRRFTYPREAEIIGRVVAYSTECVDVAPQPEVTRKPKTTKRK
jgi:transcriptional regulator with XRE-family HTH domain